MKKSIYSILIILLLIICWADTVCAESASTIMNVYTMDDMVTVFIKDTGSEIKHIFIGNKECDNYQVEENKGIRTVVLVDNSMSINASYREDIKRFITEMVAARNNEDLFTIATFSENITYLVNNSSDYLEIKDTIDDMTFNNQNSYFTKSLYTIIEDLEKENKAVYTRVVIIADGADDESFGYTDDELNKKVQAVHVPVYTIGCKTPNNSENLKRMFSISRISNAKGYLIDETEFNDILQDLADDSKNLQVNIMPSVELCDGTEKTLRIEFGDDYSSVKQAMPFKASENKVILSEEENVILSDSINEKEPPMSDSYAKLNIPGLVIIAGCILISGIFFMIFAKKRVKKDKAGKMDVPNKANYYNQEVVPARTDTGTEILGVRQDPYSKTEIISGSKSVKLCLKDLDDPSKTFEYPIRGRILIGKDVSRCQIVIDYNKYVSSVHCEVLAKGAGCFVRDGGDNVVASTNGTYVDEKRALPELPLPEGSVLRVGEVRFKVTYK